jgi:hypothetical protein
MNAETASYARARAASSVDQARSLGENATASSLDLAVGAFGSGVENLDIFDFAASSRPETVFQFRICCVTQTRARL